MCDQIRIASVSCRRTVIPVRMQFVRTVTSEQLPKLLVSVEDHVMCQKHTSERRKFSQMPCRVQWEAPVLELKHVHASNKRRTESIPTDAGSPSARFSLAILATLQQRISFYGFQGQIHLPRRKYIVVFRMFGFLVPRVSKVPTGVLHRDHGEQSGAFLARLEYEAPICICAFGTQSRRRHAWSRSDLA